MNRHQKDELDHRLTVPEIAACQGHRHLFQQYPRDAHFNCRLRHSPRRIMRPKMFRRRQMRHLYSTISIYPKHQFSQARKRPLMIRSKLRFPHFLSQSQLAFALHPSPMRQLFHSLILCIRPRLVVPSLLLSGLIPHSVREHPLHRSPSRLRTGEAPHAHATKMAIQRSSYIIYHEAPAKRPSSSSLDSLVRTESE